MAALKKYHENEIKRYLGHLTQEPYFHHKPSNSEINMSLHNLNKNMIPDRGNTKKEIFEYYQNRKNELYAINRKDTLTGFEWVITAPDGLTESQEMQFFNVSLDFLKETYGEENIITCFLHANEGIRDENNNLIYGHKHIHTMIIPVTKITKEKPAYKNYTHKICYRDVINTAHLMQWHHRFQSYCDAHLPFKAQVYKGGITRANSKDVKLQKAETKYELEHQKVLDLENEITKLREKIAEYELQQTNSWGNNATWCEYTYGG